LFSNFGIHLPTHSTYSYSDIEKIYIKTGGNPKKPNKLDAWTVLTAIAVKTKKIRLGTCVSPIPFYMPAKFGVGAGWFKDEAISYGFEWENHKERIKKC